MWYLHILIEEEEERNHENGDPFQDALNKLIASGLRSSNTSNNNSHPTTAITLCLHFIAAAAAAAAIPPSGSLELENTVVVAVLSSP